MFSDRGIYYVSKIEIQLPYTFFIDKFIISKWGRWKETHRCSYQCMEPPCSYVDLFKPRWCVRKKERHWLDTFVLHNKLYINNTIISDQAAYIWAGDSAPPPLPASHLPHIWAIFAHGLHLIVCGPKFGRNSFIWFHKFTYYVVQCYWMDVYSVGQTCTRWNGCTCTIIQQCDNMGYCFLQGRFRLRSVCKMQYYGCCC